MLSFAFFSFWFRFGLPHPRFHEQLLCRHWVNPTYPFGVSGFQTISPNTKGFEVFENWDWGSLSFADVLELLTPLQFQIFAAALNS